MQDPLGMSFEEVTRRLVAGLDAQATEAVTASLRALLQHTEYGFGDTSSPWVAMQLEAALRSEQNLTVASRRRHALYEWAGNLSATQAVPTDERDALLRGVALLAAPDRYPDNPSSHTSAYFVRSAALPDVHPVAVFVSGEDVALVSASSPEGLTATDGPPIGICTRYSRAIPESMVKLWIHGDSSSALAHLVPQLPRDIHIWLDSEELASEEPWLSLAQPHRITLSPLREEDAPEVETFARELGAGYQDIAIGDSLQAAIRFHHRMAAANSSDAQKGWRRAAAEFGNNVMDMAADWEFVHALHYFGRELDSVNRITSAQRRAATATFMSVDGDLSWSERIKLVDRELRKGTFSAETVDAIVCGTLAMAAEDAKQRAQINTDLQPEAEAAVALAKQAQRLKGEFVGLRLWKGKLAVGVKRGDIGTPDSSPQPWNMYPAQETVRIGESQPSLAAAREAMQNNSDNHRVYWFGESSAVNAAAATHVASRSRTRRHTRLEVAAAADVEEFLKPWRTARDKKKDRPATVTLAAVGDVSWLALSEIAATQGWSVQPTVIDEASAAAAIAQFAEQLPPEQAQQVKAAIQGPAPKVAANNPLRP